MALANSAPAKLSPDPLFRRLRAEAEATLKIEPLLATLLNDTVLAQDSLETAVAHRVSERLAGPEVSGASIRRAFAQYFERNGEAEAILRADLLAVLERDPACTRLLEPVLYFKGFHAIQAHRVAHAAWLGGRSDFALSLQSLSSQKFQTDIHPAARIGRGFFLDHATGVVIGATAVIEDEVSMLHAVTLGGSGKKSGERHPKVRRGVLIGAGAQVFGNIEIGAGALIAAGSVVLEDVPPHKTVAGSPARVVGDVTQAEPSLAMDQVHDVIDSGI
ncbi:serine O-acetyltransferase [Methylocystis bryophila]|uniref:Serine acetyltransferase n=1 Tax=Methylocystis bryophila TaxID=655015 RepID=A0A1W6MUJ6_9HYPH|nr:serine O-acetyltransferase [Methylocystis bryophila]ARN81273.1 serine O-acetyltransferase [Methylocystis bryophila]BDV37228.1 serine acetyltransferase [Methylocystis bryophila]